MKTKKEKIRIVHEDERRSLTSMFNGEFTAKQIKIIKVKVDSELGNHYHDYAECFYVLKGYAHYILIDVETDERREIKLEEGDRLIIDKNVAHKAFIEAGTIMIEGTEKKYISPAKNDKYYEVI